MRVFAKGFAQTGAIVSAQEMLSRCKHQSDTSQLLAQPVGP